MTDGIDWTSWEESKKKAMNDFYDDMKSLAATSPVFANIVAQEFDGTYDSVNSPKSRVRNAMMLRVVYRDSETGELDQDAWEHDLQTSDFYTGVEK